MADGTITIDVDIQKNKVKSDVQAINEEVNKIGNKAGNKLDENLDKNLNKAKSKASQTGKEIDRNLGKDHKTKITVEDYEAKHKANELKSDLNKLPKDHKVKINAETGETTEKVDSVKHKINQLPEKHNTEINATDHTEGVFARIKSHFDKVNDEGKETHSIFKSVFSANMVSDAVKGGFSYIRGALGGMIGEAKQYALEQQTMNATWLTLTNSASKGKAMVNQINNMALAAQNSTEMVDQLSQKFYAINNNAKQTGQLTKAVLTLQDAFGVTDAAVENFGTQFSQMMANGKVSGQDMLSIVNTFPKLLPMLRDYERQVHHNSQLTVKDVREMMSKGKISSQDMINTVLRAGQKYKKATGNFTATIPGMVRTIKAEIGPLSGALSKPIKSLETPLYGGIVKWLSAKKTEKEFSRMGHIVSTGMNNVMKAFGAGKSVNVTRALDNAINGINKGLKGVFGWISGHAKDLKTIASSIASIGGQIAKTVWKDFASIITTIGNMFGLTAKNGKSSASAIHVIAEFLDHLAKNKLAIQAISKAIVAMAVVKGLDKVGGGLFAIGEKGYGAYKKLKALRGGLKGLKLADEATEGEKAWYKFGKRLSSLPEIAKKAARSIKKTMNFSMGKRLAVGAVSGAAVAAPEIVNAVKDRHSADKRSQDIGGAVGALAGGTLTSMIPVVGPMLAPIGAVIGKYAGRWGGQAVNKFTKGWQRHKPPKKFWSLENLGWSTRDTFRKVGKWGSDVGKKFGQGLRKGKSFAKKNSKELALTAVSPLLGIPALLYKNNPKFRKWANSVGRNVKKGLKAAGKVVNSFKNSLARNFKKAWDSAYKHSSKGTRQIMRSVSKFTKNYVKTNSKANRATLKNFSSFGARLKKNHGNLFKTLGQTARTQLAIEKRRWSSNWKNIRSAAAGIWKGINRNASDMYHKLNSATHGGLGKVFDGFKSFGKSIAGFWTDLWKNVTKTFSDTIKGLKDAANNVGKFFTGKLKVGSLHLAGGTDWRKRWATPAILNDGTDSPATHNRESIIHGDGSWELLPDIPFLRRFLLPGDDVVNAKDTANMFGRAYHFANGTVGLNKLTIDLAKPDKDNLNKILSTVVKQYNLDTTEATKRHQRERDKDAKERKRNATAKSGNAKERKDNFKWNIDNKRQKGDILIDKGLLTGARKETGKQTWINEKLFKRLMSYTKARPIKVSKHSRIRYRAIPAKRDGKDYLVDSHWLTGGKSNTGKLEKITREGFLKLLQFTKKERKYKLPKNKRKKTKRNKTRKRRSSSREHESRSYSTRRSSSRRSYSSGSYSIGSTSSRISASVSGLKEVRALSKAVKAIKGKKVKISAKASGTKSVKGLAKAVKAIKSKKRTVTVKAKGTKALKSLYRATKRIKGSTHKVRVKTYGESALKSLRKNISEVGKTAENLTKTLRGKGNFAKEIDKLVKSSDKAFKSLYSNATKSFKSMWSQLEKNTRSGERSITNQTNRFADKFRKQFRSIQNDIEKSFGHFWNSMKSEARKGLNGVIGVLNQAIGKIDNVVGQFGGSKSAVHKVQGLATGTGALGGGVRRPIVSPTWAVLNDGNDSPETGNREAVWNRYTGNVDVIQGRFTPRYMRPGEEVFNATETKALGLTVPHFATGTGALKELYHIAKHNWEKPKQTGQALFSAVNGLKGAINAIAQGANAKGEKAGINWWSQLWKMVEDKVDDDDLGPASGLLKAVEQLGHGKRYSESKRMSKFFADCSSLVSRALHDYYHVKWSEPNGWALTVAGLWQHAHKIPASEAKPGDPVFWLPDTHVGVYAGHGKYYSAYGPDDGGPVGMQSVASGATFGRFDGLDTRGDKSKDDVKVKANNKIQKKIRDQVGKGFWKTIEKIANKYGDNIMIKGVATPEQARRVIKRAMEIAGVSGDAWLHGLETIASHESSFRNVVNTWDSNAAAGTPSAGWFQMIQPTFEANHKPGYNKWRNPLDQAISAIRYIKNKYGGINNVPGIVSLAHGGPYKGYARGGIVTNPQVALVGEGNGPESIIPWDPAQRDRALDIMLSTLTQFKAQDGKTQQFQQQGQQVVDLSQTNAEIQAINDKFDQALAELGVLSNKNEIIQLTNVLNKREVGQAMYEVTSKMIQRQVRNEAHRISGH